MSTAALIKSYLSSINLSCWVPSFLKVDSHAFSLKYRCPWTHFSGDWENVVALLALWRNLKAQLIMRFKRNIKVITSTIAGGEPTGFILSPNLCFLFFRRFCSLLSLAHITRLMTTAAELKLLTKLIWVRVQVLCGAKWSISCSSRLYATLNFVPSTDV